tara:strand:+ start:2953 stop:3576 length:624 start_codon:yes stop_codon:yes gene_type:complete
MSRKPKFWIKAKRELCLKDKKLARIINKYPKDFLYSKSDPYKTLARSIIGQQISVKAAQAVWDRFENKCNNVSPEKVIKLHHMTLKSCGLSHQKVTYLKCLSNAFIDKTLEPDSWVKLDDEEIISQLTKVKGIGRWTAEMYLIFNLCRPNVFPVTDIGVIRGICECYKLKYPINVHRAINISEKWKPWRSVATWYLWRSLDPIPVEY